MKSFTEVIKLKDGVFYNLEYHQDRVDRTCSQFSIPRFELSNLLKDIPETAKKGLMKCRIEYGDNINKVEYLPYSFRNIRTVTLVSDNTIEYSYKYADRNQLNQLLSSTGCDEMIIVKNGLITDASAFNLVFESADGLYTPIDCLLKGTKRQILLDKQTIEEVRITANDFLKYNKVYFINAMVDLEDNICISIADIAKH